jgi:hypothetical protein
MVKRSEAGEVELSCYPFSCQQERTGPCTSGLFRNARNLKAPSFLEDHYKVDVQWSLGWIPGLVNFCCRSSTVPAKATLIHIHPNPARLGQP